MHPAPSIIVFTALSGLGLGLIAWMGLGQPSVGGWIVIVYSLIALGLTGAGLAASLFHLGNPQRAMLALSQWRTSWLSREGILAIATILVFMAYAATWIFTTSRSTILGHICTVMAVLTVFATSMIYAQLKAVPRWNTFFTPVLFVLYSLAGGALLAGLVQIASLLMVVLAAAQISAWIYGDGAFRRSGATLASATGLGRLGRLRQLEPPHTGSNYVLREMVFAVGRKHMAPLRVLSVLLTGLVPAYLIQAYEIGHLFAAVLVAMHLAGLFVARWLFFAEAEHVVGLYYDKR